MRPRFELSDEGASGSHCRWVGHGAEGEAVLRGKRNGGEMHPEAGYVVRFLLLQACGKDRRVSYR